MINDFEKLSEPEQQEVTEIIQLLYRQTFILERKYDKRLGRMQYSHEFRLCNKHLEFIRAYMSIAGISVLENSQIGMIYIRGEGVVGEKLPRLATLYILVLKLLYDEQMTSASSNTDVILRLGDIHEKLSSYHLLRKQPSITEIRKALAVLKKYQVIEPLDVLEDMDGKSRFMIYPTIHVVLYGDDVRNLLDSFAEGEEEDDESEI